MSTSGKKAKQSAQIVLDAIREADVRAILQGWDAETLRSLGASSNVYCAGSMPHDWLFDRVSAVIHHGGFGTTAAGFRSGMPSIVIPHIIDQYYWGQRVFELGVSPNLISCGKLTADNLADAIRQSLTNQTMRAKAAELGDAICREPDGVMGAIKLIEKTI